MARCGPMWPDPAPHTTTGTQCAGTVPCQPIGNSDVPNHQLKALPSVKLKTYVDGERWSVDRRAGRGVPGRTDGSGTEMIMEGGATEVVERDNTKAIEAIGRALAASETLREELLHGEASGRMMLDELRGGMAFVDAVHVTGASAAELRERVDVPLDRYREARRLVRLAMIEDGLRAGLSRGRIAALLGVTRQRVTILAKELDISVGPG